MIIFPKLIKITICDIDTKLPEEGIAVKIHIFANHKNDYEMIPKTSNGEGEILLDREWVCKKIEATKALFPMDYSSTINDCKPCIEIELMNCDAISRAIEAMEEWQSILKIPQEEIENLKTAKNVMYKPTRTFVQFNNGDAVEVRIETKKL